MNLGSAAGRELFQLSVDAQEEVPMQSHSGKHAVQTSFFPEDMDCLQGCFNHIIKIRHLERPGQDAEAVAQALIVAFQRGVREPEELMRLADLQARDVLGNEKLA